MDFKRILKFLSCIKKKKTIYDFNWLIPIALCEKILFSFCPKVTKKLMFGSLTKICFAILNKR